MLRTILAIGLLCLTQTAAAHLLNMSKARVSVAPDGGITLTLALDLLVTAGGRQRYYDLSQINDPMQNAEVQELLSPLPDAIDLRSEGQRLPLELNSVRFPDETRETFLDPLSWPRTDIVLTTPLPEGQTNPTLQIRYVPGFRFEEPIANTFFNEATGKNQTRWLVTEQLSPVFVVSETPGISESASRETDWRGLWDFLVAGYRHILPAGADHLLFVAALGVGALSLGSLLGIITLFTLAHSITLAATALALISPPASIVEPIIIASILWAALENLSTRGAGKLRILTVLIFGLIHGMGFATALRDIGLPAEQQLWSLLAFNLGVEAGQIVFLAALMLLLYVALRLYLKVTNKAPVGTLLPLPLSWRRSLSLIIALLTFALLATR